MKLYTEEQIKQVIAYYNTEKFVTTDELLKDLNLTPIELPSDEEMEKFLLDNSYEYGYGYKDAINWIKKQILNQNK